MVRCLDRVVPVSYFKGPPSQNDKKLLLQITNPNPIILTLTLTVILIRAHSCHFFALDCIKNTEFPLHCYTNIKFWYLCISMCIEEINYQYCFLCIF